MNKKIKIILIGLVIIAAIAVIGLYSVASNFLDTAPTTQEESTKVVIEIAPGSGLSTVSKQLFDANIITNELFFKLYVRNEEKEADLQAGSLEFDTSWKPEQVLHELMFGKSVAKAVEIPEGLPWWKVARILESKGYVTFEDFEAVIHDPEFLAKHHIPFDNAEGFLYPETYQFVKPYALDKESAEVIIGKMIDHFWQETKPLWKELSDDEYPSASILTNYLILASIVDKETGVSLEKARVAGVYANRLRTNMRLQADPTVIYGLGEDFKLPLYTKHLRDDSNPYNTYAMTGLPPAPISSPTYSDIEAAIHPEVHNYFYFVAKGGGGVGEHYFSTTYKEHQANVAKYRKTLGR